AVNSLKPPEEVRRRVRAESPAHRQVPSYRPSNTNMTSITMTNRSHNQLIALVAICVAGFWTGCATNPPPLPPGNPADPQVRAHTKGVSDLLVPDETTLAIEKELSQTESTAKSSESMQHEGMQHGGMQGMQHEGMRMDQPDQMKQSGEMEGHAGMQHGAVAQPEKKAVADEM